MEKTSVFGDPALSSSQLRTKAYEIISKASRPLAACEIESWIRNNDPFLWKRVSIKCKDYVRIILSQTRGDKISKFKCLKPPNDVDKRSNFFGISGRSYNPNDWVLVEDDKHKTNKKSNKDSSSESYSSAQTGYADKSIDIKSPANLVIEEAPQQKKRIILPPLPSWVIENNRLYDQKFTFLGNSILPSLSLFNYQ